MLFQLPLALSTLVLAAIAIANDPTLPACGLKCATDIPPKSPCLYVTNVSCACTNEVYSKLFQDCIVQGCNNSKDLQAVADFGRETCKLLNITPDTGGLDGKFWCALWDRLDTIRAGSPKTSQPSTDSHQQNVNSSLSGPSSSAASPPPASSHAPILICLGLVSIGITALI
ncbi:BZ3500_MvSof-1268-A1-R1_Chr7-1g09238 [Microbotryum saponariae]|uniref:BZ3500_MvSof-1268-A1-R1_Chr7-1g09238 protein n=1 Tax=Microbotryum saponariae TaxID=289078 RepID=A0A2X0N0I8_9BASI|nr:BZ3501_MvSof-1269-A2-R1_Chr7-1g08943 [Microbotryum saponariae]SDA03059.1 BZ3500_MvSof-1268-A1-R1_Chr7-1g09238 [Microbotryum saponariae]